MINPALSPLDSSPPHLSPLETVIEEQTNKKTFPGPASDGEDLRSCMIKNTLQVAAVVVVLVLFAFITISPAFGLQLDLSSTSQVLTIAIAMALMFIMGLWHFVRTPKVVKVNADR